MRIIGLYGGQDQDGLTATLTRAVLEAADAETEFIDLNAYPLRPDQKGQENAPLDELEAKLATADVWVLATPSYYGTVAGQFKQFFDCFRPRMTRMNSVGDTLPGQYQGKHYVSITSCFASAWDNTFTHQTDATLRMIDKAMSLAGLNKVTELILPGTWGMHTGVPPHKLQEAQAVGRRLTGKDHKEDQTMKRYVLLFAMIAVTALITMGIQLVVPVLTQSFWARYASFVVIFFGLLAGALHYATFRRHKRR